VAPNQPYSLLSVTAWVLSREHSPLTDFNGPAPLNECPIREKELGVGAGRAEPDQRIGARLENRRAELIRSGPPPA